ncbi:TPA: HeH/LEM domain-containing protein [Streptococcus suis]|uniref:HeH/LEM domain-containing protein n=1 Tax=Streptococcus suis TaxID=1307 RepID=A0AAP6DWF9_STRSU|nr:HeH/LEM domain-containing protein [Streptococcus suis]MDW8635429.1 HeH/LEM domain-containing protein [Streptococcus suis]
MELIKVEVTEEFFDKVVKLDRAVGDVFEVDSERLEVLLGENSEKRAFVKVLEESEVETDYSKLKTEDIKALLTEKGIEFDKSAKKSDLIALLTAE